jgi:WD40 repeat protein
MLPLASAPRSSPQKGAGLSMPCRHYLLLATSVLLAGAIPGQADEPDAPADLQPITPVSRVRTFNFQHYMQAMALTLSPDGVSAAALQGNAIQVYDLTKSQERNVPRNIFLESVPLHDGAAAFSSDGKSLIVLGPQHSDDQALHFIDLSGGKEIRQIDNDQPFSCVTLSSDGKLLALGAPQGHVEIWDAATGDEIRVLAGLGSGACATLGFSRDGRMLAVVLTSFTQQPSGTMRAESTIQLLEVATGRKRREFNIRTQPGDANQMHYRGSGPLHVGAVAFSTDGKLLAAGCSDLTIHIWNLQADRDLAPLIGHQGIPSSLVFTADGKRLLSLDTTGVRLAWNVTQIERPAASKLRHLSDAEFEDLWTDLGDGDAFHVYRAGRYLKADPSRAIALLRGHVKPVPIGDAKRLAQLVADLQNANAGVRRKAMRCIREQGEAALGALSADGGAQRGGKFGGMGGMPGRGGQGLVRRLEAQYATPERARALKAVDVLEELGTPEAHQLLEQVAAGAPGTKLTVAAHSALDRLAAERKTAHSNDGGKTPEQRRSTPLTAKDTDRLWQDLAGEDTAQAFRAMNVLRGSSEQALALFRERLHPEPLPPLERIPQLIVDLDNNRFTVREQATRELETIGTSAEPALRAALERQPSTEVRRRLEYLLTKIGPRNLTHDALRGVRAIEVLEQIGSGDARQILATLTKGRADSVLVKEAKRSMERLGEHPTMTP